MGTSPDSRHLKILEINRPFRSELSEMILELLAPGSRLLEVGGRHPETETPFPALFAFPASSVYGRGLDSELQVIARHHISSASLISHPRETGEAEFKLVFGQCPIKAHDQATLSEILRGMASRSTGFVLLLVPNEHSPWFPLWWAGIGQGEGATPPPIYSDRDVMEVMLAAGLRPLAQRFLGSSLSEAVLSNISGLDPDLRRRLLATNEAETFPWYRRCCVTGFLAAVPGFDPHPIPPGWSQPMVDSSTERAASSPSALVACESTRRWRAERRLRSAEAQLCAASRELAQMKASRPWKLGLAYWALLRRLRQSLSLLTRRSPTPGSSLPADPVNWIAAGDRPTYDVLYLPINDWSFRFQRSQQIASQFARNGHRVFYVRTSSNAPPNRKADGPPALEVLAEGIYGVRLPGMLQQRRFQSRIGDSTLEDWLNSLEHLRAAADVITAVCIVELPFWTRLALAARERWSWKVLYDCMDEHSGFSTNSSTMLQEESTLINRSDLVITTSRALHDKVARQARSVIRLPNATDFDHFHAPAPYPQELQGLPHPIIGYYGAISEWFDLDMVSRAASRHPEWTFLLIGHASDIDTSAVEDLENVHFLGERPYSEIPAYLQAFDVAMIPFKVNALTEATDPVKFYEYLSAGKPVVSVELPELRELSELYYPVTKRDGFEAQITSALGESSSSRSHPRVHFARQNTWVQRHDQLSRRITQCFGRASIIIVSFNKVEMLRMCLESIRTQTVYPNYEIIVVDNASDDKTRVFLSTYSGGHPEVHTIFNEENLGFPRANNLGIEAAASSEFIALLNDDTIVSRGWLSRLIAHLDRPGVELVGPVTNSIGNEAQIATSYRNLDEMTELARNRRRLFEGKIIDLERLAMFCVVMRRSLVDRVGFLDERFGIGMFEDDDFSLRVQRAGGRTVCAEDVFVHHWGRASFGEMKSDRYRALFERNRALFEDKWRTAWLPHRSRDDEDP